MTRRLLSSLESRPGRYMLAAASGLLLALAFPRPAIFPFIFIGLIPLLFALKNQNGWSAFILGWVMGLVHSVVLVYWLVRVLTFYGGLNIILALAGFLILTAYSGAYFGFFALGLSYAESRFKLRPLSITWILAGSVIFTGLEYLKGILFTGIPWDPIGSALVVYLPLIQFSDIVGTGGISLLTAVVSFSLFAIISHSYNRKFKQILFPAILVVVIVGGLFVYGNLRLQSIENKLAKADNINVVVVQANIDQLDKWNPDKRVDILIKYEALTFKAAESKPDLIIWPEAATPFYFLRQRGETNWLKKLAYDVNTPILFGSLAYRGKKEERRHFNRVYLVDRDGRPMAHYDKVHLVPYGEYVPLEPLFPWIHKLSQAAGRFSAGEPGQLIELNGYQLGVLICYESLFSSLARTQVLKGAGVLINPTNDAWFGKTSAPYQLLYMSALRAVENRRTMIRAANTGISAIILPTGKVGEQLGLFEDGILPMNAPVLNIETIYTKIGDVIPQICLGVTLLMFAIVIIRRRKCSQI